VPLVNVYLEELFQPFSILRFLDIGTSHGETEVAKDFSDAAHTDATDPDKVYVFNVTKHLPFS